jgi:hypothetical protein
MAYFEGEVPVVSTGNYGNNGWNDWSWIIGLAVVGGIFGNGGFGFGGNNRPNCATQADLSAGFNNSAVLSNLNDIILGQATMQNFINQGFSGLNQTVTNGFAGINNAVCTLGYQQAQLVNGLSRELADCCCATQRAIDGVNYNNAKNTCDIIRAGQDNTRAILDFLTSEKISSLQAENSGLKAQISNDRQTRNIVDELRNGNCPVPAYLACDPRVPVSYYGNSGCGCC